MVQLAPEAPEALATLEALELLPPPEVLVLLLALEALVVREAPGGLEISPYFIHSPCCY
ncbi:hypothetical protein D3C87_2158310 [compost metagenome]